ncbi:MAG: TonB-dependent receptor, partial [Acidobacteria bacterium]|nr:TonB-dependent receptor [Acidobacteriota bacterium]
MNRVAAFSAALLAGILLGSPAFGQGTQTGILGGVVRTSDGLLLPGATVTILSDSLQGDRLATSDAAGAFIFRGLPHGRYVVKFEMSGLTPLERVADVPLGGRSELDVTMVHNAPSTGQVTISGAFAYDNVFLLDGVDINDNLYGYPNDLFIEDAIEETQVLTSGVPAEYGRFSGGVVNAVTKRGGDSFSGSFRVNLTNPSWTDETPLETEQGTERQNKLSQSLEATFGGRLVRSRLWFFSAGRRQNTDVETALPETGIPFVDSTKNRRYEIKLTGKPATNHTVEGVFINNATERVRVAFPFTIDPRAVVQPTVPNRLYVANYRGVITPTIFAEVQYSRKTFAFLNSGGTGTALTDSPFIGQNPFSHYNAPFFDATDPEDRNNRQIAGSIAYFKSTRTRGRHDLKGGLEVFTTTRTGGNSQSPTGYVYFSDYKLVGGSIALDASGRLIPQFVPEGSLLFTYPAERGAKLDIKTTSLYLQDRWIYMGPAGEGLGFAPGLDPANYLTVAGTFPTANVFFDDHLSSPSTREFTLAGATNIGAGYARVTYIKRDVRNVVENFVTLETGETTVVRDRINFGTFSNVVYRNSDLPKRHYDAFVLHARHPVHPRVTVQGHWTIQLRNRGNFEGEAPNEAAISSVIGDYPEIYSEARHFPSGRLDDFQRHKIRAWATMRVPAGRWGHVIVAPLYRYDSGITYSLRVANQRLTSIQGTRGAGYASLPANQTIYFADRGSEDFKGAHLVDLAVNYDIPVWRSVRPWLKVEIFNLLNNDTLIQWNTSASPHPASPVDDLGLRTGFLRGARFGQGTANTHYPV